MAAELEEFARRVFADQGCMARAGGRGVRADRIYALYCSFSGRPVDSGPPSAAELDYFRSLGKVAAKANHLRGYFQNSRVADASGRRVVRLDFDTALELIERTQTLPLSALTDFLFFAPPVVPDGVTYRLYLNVNRASVPLVFQSIQSYMLRYRFDAGVCKFKVCGPRDVGSRAETFVVYCQNEAAARRLGTNLAAAHRGPEFGPTVPALTSRLPNTAGGLAVGAEPVPQATGMKGRREGEAYRESSQSFGTVRSEILAVAVENYLENGDRTEGDSEQDIFHRFVCAAFRGFGLDPMNPGG
jgi:hypothetical protein